MSSGTPEWIQDGDEWTVTVGGTVYTASLSPDQYGRAEYYVRGGGQSFPDRSGDWKSLERALAAIVEHEARKP